MKGEIMNGHFVGLKNGGGIAPNGHTTNGYTTDEHMNGQTTNGHVNNGYMNGYMTGYGADMDNSYTNGYMNGHNMDDDVMSGGESTDHMSVETESQASGSWTHEDSHSSGRSVQDDLEEEEDEDEDAQLEMLENWIDDKEEDNNAKSKSKVATKMLLSLPPSVPKRPTEMTARERARKASRELIKERNDTTGGARRSLKREHLIIKWILRITHLNKDGSIDFADWIQDGTVLSQVMTTLCFNSVERDKFGSAGCSPQEERIKSLQAQILDYGVEQKFMFRVQDILLKKNTPKVIRCLEEVAKLSRAETHIKLDTLIKNKLYT